MMGRLSVIKTILIALVLGGLIFYSETGPVKTIGGFSLGAFRPLMSAAMSVRSLFADFSKENEFSREDAAFRYEIERLNQENESLRKILRFVNESGISLKGARVLLYATEGNREYLVTDQGAASGVKAGDFVVDGSGALLGKVVEAGEDFSKVSVASNIGETFEAEIIPLGIKTIARGLGGRAFSLDLISSDAVLRNGDFVAARNGNSTKIFLGQVSSIGKGGTGAFREVGAVFLQHPENLLNVFIVVKKQ